LQEKEETEMKRRSFLKIFGQATAAVVAAPVIAKIPEQAIGHVDDPATYAWVGEANVDSYKARGFGLVDVKPEGAAVQYDPAAELAKSMRETKERVAANVYNKAFK
jgi:hypothetical protein